MSNQDISWKTAHRIGIFLVILFAICFAWFYIQPAETELHLRLFRLSYYGYNGMDVTSFILAAIQTYVWAYIAVAAWNVARKLS